jgi:capsular exopolysaccharide synthesis family protein
MRLPASYQSEAQVLVWKKQPNAMTSVEATHAGAAVDDSLATHQELLKSSLIIENALRESGLAGAASLQSEKDTPTDVARDHLVVSRGKVTALNTNVLQIGFRGKDGAECPAILTALLSSYKHFLDTKYQTFTDDSLGQVLRERAELEKELTRKEAAYQAFLEKSPLLMKKTDGTDLRRERLTTIQSKRSALLLRASELRSELESIEKAIAQGKNRATILAMIAEFSQKADEGDLSRVGAAIHPSDQLTPLLLEEQKLLERYGPGHPEVQSVRKRIAIARSHVVLPAAAWDKSLSPLSPAGGQGQGAKGEKKPEQPPLSDDPIEQHLLILREKLTHITRTEQSLNELFNSEQEEARKQARYEIQDDGLHNSILLTRQAYDSLNKRLQDVNLFKSTGGYDVEIITPPSASRKVSPKIYITLPAGALLGLLAALALGYLRELTDQRLHSPRDVREQLGLPVVGCIPHFTAAKKQRAAAGSLLLDRMLCAYHQSSSRQAEAFRSLRNALFFQAHGFGPKILQITSPEARAGKSTVAANLSICIAQSGKKVLLIDADLHRPRIHELFQLASRSGLGQVLAGEVEVTSAIQECGIPGLTVLIAGPPPHHPSDLLTAPAFKEMLDRLRNLYDFIVVDTPALLSATAAAAVAARVDGVLLTVRQDRSVRWGLDRALDMLTLVGAKILGAVVNDTSPRTGLHLYGSGSEPVFANVSHANATNGVARTAPADNPAR